jgi:hypothetical protein
MTRTRLLVALGITLTLVLLTSCQSSSLSNVCERYGMEPNTLEAIGLDHDINGKGFTQVKLTCKPKLKLKNGR